MFISTRKKTEKLSYKKGIVINTNEEPIKKEMFKNINLD